MRLVLVVNPAPTPKRLEQLTAFHLAAGVDELVPPGDEGAADWVIDGEPDEFWWPRGGSLKDVLAAVPREHGAVNAIVRHFLPVADGGPEDTEPTIYRFAPQAPVKASPLAPQRKPVRRGRGSTRPLRGWYPIEVLRLPATDQEALGVEAIQSGLRDGIVVKDERLRNALRAIAAGTTPEFSRPNVLEDALFAADVAVLGEADVIRARECLDELESRVAGIESLTPLRLERRLRTLVRRRRGTP